MISLQLVFSLLHLLGLSLGLGAATVKLVLVLKGYADREFVPVLIEVTKPVTRLIVLGLILLTVSGIGWLITGYPLTWVLIVKLCLVGAIWILGPVIDNVVEPRFHGSTPAPGEPAAPEFLRAQKNHLVLEVIATGLFYSITALWILF